MSVISYVTMKDEIFPTQYKDGQRISKSVFIHRQFVLVEKPKESTKKLSEIIRLLTYPGMQAQ